MIRMFRFNVTVQALDRDVSNSSHSHHESIAPHPHGPASVGSDLPHRGGGRRDGAENLYGAWDHKDMSQLST